MTVILLIPFLFGSDFPICTAGDFQDYPVVKYAEGLFHVFWTDRRFYSANEKFAIYGARVNPDGHVMDPNGKMLFCDSTSEKVDVAYDLSDFFIVARNHC